FGGTGHGTQSAGGATFSTIVIAVEHMHATVHRAECSFLFRIPYGCLAAKQMSKCDGDAPDDCRKIDPFEEGHVRVLHYFRPSRQRFHIRSVNIITSPVMATFAIASGINTRHPRYIS